MQAYTLIDFDNLPATSGFFQGTEIAPQAQLSNQLENQGVIFSTGLGANYVAVVPLGLGHATSGTNGISMAAPDNTVTYDAPYYTLIEFVDPSDPSVAGVTNFASIRGDHAGSSNTLTMEAFDINGNLLGTDSKPDVGGETVSLSVPGIHTVYILTTAQGDSGGIGLDDLSFNSPVPASRYLAVTTQPPASVTAGAGFGCTVTAENASGSVLTSFNGSVTVALETNPGDTTLGGTLTATAQNGVAMFSGLTLDTAANGYALLVSTSGLSSTTTSAINVTPATATQLLVTSQPPSRVIAGMGFGLTATALDPYGNVDTNLRRRSYRRPVSQSRRSYARRHAHRRLPRAAWLPSLALTLDKAGTGYRLQVTANGLTDADH